LPILFPLRFVRTLRLRLIALEGRATLRAASAAPTAQSAAPAKERDTHNLFPVTGNQSASSCDAVAPQGSIWQKVSLQAVPELSNEGQHDQKRSE